jgi:hypothetical protein
LNGEPHRASNCSPAPASLPRIKGSRQYAVSIGPLIVCLILPLSRAIQVASALGIDQYLGRTTLTALQQRPDQFIGVSMGSSRSVVRDTRLVGQAALHDHMPSRSGKLSKRPSPAPSSGGLLELILRSAPNCTMLHLVRGVASR